MDGKLINIGRAGFFLYRNPNWLVEANELYSVLVTMQQLKHIWYVQLSCPQWGLLRQTAHLSDLLHLGIDFYMWPWTFEISFSKPCQSRIGKRTRENQFKLISEMRCFCLLLSATLILNGSIAWESQSPGYKKNEVKTWFDFFNPRGDGIIHCLRLQGQPNKKKTHIFWIRLWNWGSCSD